MRRTPSSSCSSRTRCWTASSATATCSRRSSRSCRSSHGFEDLQVARRQASLEPAPRRRRDARLRRARARGDERDLPHGLGRVPAPRPLPRRVRERTHHRPALPEGAGHRRRGVLPPRARAQLGGPQPGPARPQDRPVHRALAHARAIGHRRPPARRLPADRGDGACEGVAARLGLRSHLQLHGSALQRPASVPHAPLPACGRPPVSEDPQPSYTRLRHLQAISEAALAHLRFDELLEELLRRVSGVLDTDTAAVLLLDEATNELVARAAKGIEEEVEQGVRIPVGRGFAGRIAAERRTIAVPDVDHADILNPILREKGLVSMLGAPLLVEGRVIGVMHVGTLHRRDFTDEDAQLLQLAADRMAVAIDHARLYESERHAVEQLRKLESVTEAALSHLALDELFDVLLARLRDLLGTDIVAVLLRRGDELHTRAALGLDEWMDRDLTVKVGEGFVGRVAAERRPIALNEVQASDVRSAPLAQSGVASLLGVPLITAGEAIGVLSVGTWEPRRFERDDIELLSRAGDRIAIAIDNARLYGAERLARAQAERAASRLQRMESITQVAFNHLSVDEEVLEQLLSRVREVLDTDTAAVYELDDEEQTLVARAAKGMGGEDVERGVRVPVGHGFAGLVAER